MTSGMSSFPLKMVLDLDCTMKCILDRGTITFSDVFVYHHDLFGEQVCLSSSEAMLLLLPLASGHCQWPSHRLWWDKELVVDYKPTISLRTLFSSAGLFFTARPSQCRKLCVGFHSETSSSSYCGLPLWAALVSDTIFSIVFLFCVVIDLVSSSFLLSTNFKQMELLRAEILQRILKDSPEEGSW